MNQKNESIDTDARLADFTDRLLDGETAPIASASDEELIRLQQTVLRLTHALPPEQQTDAARAKQMLVRFKSRVKREEAQAARPSLWKRLFDFQSNPQAALVPVLLAVLVVAAIALPLIELPGSSATGSAINGVNVYLAAGLVLILLAVYWVSRNK